MATKNAINEPILGADWPSKHEEIFISILHDHVKKGDSQRSTFKRKVWLEIGDELFAEFGKRSGDVGKRQVEEQLRRDSGKKAGGVICLRGGKKKECGAFQLSVGAVGGCRSGLELISGGEQEGLEAKGHCGTII
ncbi:PREDICTED: L10-interacting MYB domain-containing-like [Prunus dulcis]|uniref:PREDICTED: L10-interacting MYB domain-containing-like n=1 Tax=Prunus dulcis TaxID=3755 RepID=A0A5E4GA80_PRUDU|nr:hypothetical protein L3X38_024782 [Prunus dulcis]VVA36522.1 PREDICTED: L10-interacting MYB domain-containing-like [Prunus dulcis]